MASSFPKMQKSSASFSQSIKNRLRLKNLQAQAKNFCRVLDIRVSKIMKAYPRHRPCGISARPFGLQAEPLYLEIEDSFT